MSFFHDKVKYILGNLLISIALYLWSDTNFLIYKCSNCIYDMPVS